MERKEKTQETNEEKKEQFGCFEPSSRIGKMMMKMIKKMCGSPGKGRFDCESKMSEMKCCKASN
ncbi:hypothetical protein ACFLSH_00190 [Bacteroidota bacterium]